MLRVLMLPVLMLPLLAPSSQARGREGDAAPSVRESRYLCAEGREVRLTYFFGGASPGMAVMGFDGKQVAMRQTRSGSGIRFTALDEQAGLRWHAKGAVGVVRFLAADHTAREVVLARDCREVESRLHIMQR